MRLGGRVGDAVTRLSDRFGSAEAGGLRLVSRQLANRFGETRDVTSEGGEIGGEVSGCGLNVFCREKSSRIERPATPRRRRRCGPARGCRSVASAARRARLPLSVTIFCGDHAKTELGNYSAHLEGSGRSRSTTPSVIHGWRCGVSIFRVWLIADRCACIASSRQFSPTRRILQDAP